MNPVTFLLLPLPFSLVSCAAISQESGPADAISEAKWSDYAEHYPVSALCTDDEVTLWSCGFEQREFALCSSREMSRDAGHLQYRVAEAGAVVFVYPEVKQPPAGLFTFETFANGDAALGFVHDGQRYAVVDRLRGEGSVTVRAADGSSDEVDCAGNQTLQLNYTLRLMHEAGMWRR